ncbi:MAG: undecaprenyl-phosphate glucose phosphotransferase [Candidatus Binatia bacterium]
MLKQHNELFKGLLVVSDLCFVSLAWWLAYFVRFHSDVFNDLEPYLLRHYVSAWLIVLVVWAGVFELCDFYRPRRISTHLREIGELLKASALALLVFLAVIFLVRELALSRIFVAIFWLLSVFLLNVSHIACREGLRHLRRRGHNLRHVLIVGMPAQVRALFDRLRSYRHLGLRVAAIYFLQPDERADPSYEKRLLRSPQQVSEWVRSGRVDQVFAALPLEQASKVREIQEWLGDEPVTLHLVPDLAELATLRGDIEVFDGLHLISLQSSPLNGWNALMKRTLDVVLSIIALIVFLPVMAMIAVAIKCLSPGPVLYRQQRMGLDRRQFELIKFRTMVDNAERATGPVWAAENDSRITVLGGWLRRTSLDELPQLFNVLRGEMSLVGPRPERPPLIDEFRKSIPKYMLRHKVKAGMTGWAQIHGWRGNTSLATRIKYDLDYIENWSFWRDIKILALTLFRGWRNNRRHTVDSVN